MVYQRIGFSPDSCAQSDTNEKVSESDDNSCPKEYACEKVSENDDDRCPKEYASESHSTDVRRHTRSNQGRNLCSQRTAVYLSSGLLNDRHLHTDLYLCRLSAHPDIFRCFVFEKAGTNEMGLPKASE